MKAFKRISAEEISMGKNVVIEENVTFEGINGPARKVLIGDNVFIGHDTKILCSESTILNYTKVHNHTFIHGHRPWHIIYNCWIGQNTIIDNDAILPCPNSSVIQWRAR